MFHTGFKLTGTTAAAVITVGVAIAISSLGVVRAERFNPDKKSTTLFKCSSGTACLTADSTGPYTYAAYATTTAEDAVHAVTSSPYGASALAGISTATSGGGRGVYGASSAGDGVYGTTNAAFNGSSFYAGVYGYSDSSGYGVLGESGSSGGLPAVAAQSDGDQSIFYGLDTKTGADCVIDASADLYCDGTISGVRMETRQRTSSGRRVLSYASQSASATIEDVGTARMIEGVANVQIGPDFAGVMDGKWYYVFLTPLGDTRGLYVSMKTASGFQVRETERGRDSLEFDYRIVAHPLGAPNDRLPVDRATRRVAFFPRRN